MKLRLAVTAGKLDKQEDSWKLMYISFLSHPKAPQVL
jgi:hypothetical protein